jgi:hypothetical protein
MSKKTETTTTQNTNTEDRKQVEALVDELLDKVIGGNSACQHCNQPCGDCVQPSLS